jgi:hypothetical protein
MTPMAVTHAAFGVAAALVVVALVGALLLYRWVRPRR